MQHQRMKLWKNSKITQLLCLIQSIVINRSQILYLFFCIILRWQLKGEVPERLKGHAWKACVRVTVPRVQIPASPLNLKRVWSVESGVLS